MSTTSGDIGMNLSTAAATLARLKTAVGKDDFVNSDKELAALKKLFIHFPTYLSPNTESKTKPQEVVIVQETLEHAILLAAKRKDMDSFESNFHQLQIYYTSGVTSERRLMLLGLNLLRLLVCDKISEFHSELDRIPFSDHTSMYIKNPILLERYMMEGSYHKLLNARGQVPASEFLPVVEMLEDTVREDIAKCIPKTYSLLTVSAARKMLMLPSDEALNEFATKRDWKKNKEGVFEFSRPDTITGRKELPFKQALHDYIDLAAQLQKVV